MVRAALLHPGSLPPAVAVSGARHGAATVDLATPTVVSDAGATAFGRDGSTAGAENRGIPFASPARNRLYIALERWAARRCHALVSVCDAMTAQALAAGVGRPEPFRTVYSGMEVEAFLNPARPRAEVRRELGLADDEVAFGTVARLFELKGHDDILAAAPKILAADPRVRFVFIGDGIWRDPERGSSFAATAPSSWS